MKRLSLTILLGVCIICCAKAQTAPTGGFRRAGTNAQTKAMHRQQLKDSLGLTQDQALKVDAIQQDFMLKMRAVKLSTTLTDSARRAQLQQLQAERKEKLSAVISTEQRNKLDGRRSKPVRKSRQAKAAPVSMK